VQLNLANKLKYSFLKDATIVAPSSWIADSASNSAVFRNSNLIVIPNPIHEVFFSPKIPALPRPPSLPTSIVFSLIATDLGDPNKRVAEVCEALSAVELTSPGIDIKLVLIGARGGKFADKYRFVSLLGVLDAIGIVQILDTIDANISFSIVETSPLTIAECAARGVPTIASNNKGASAIINSLNCGSTVNDIHDLRLMLEQALQNKVTSGVVGIGSDLMTANAMNSHRPEKVASRYENEYANWKIGRRGPNK
jgi:glycosyltransferase involved in cell wall biosynthesis